MFRIVFFWISTLIISLSLILASLPIPEVWADQAKIKELEQKLSQTQSTAKTLKSEIVKLDDQVELTTLRISQTEEELAKLENEIGVLSGRIDRIRGNLTTQSDKVLIRITNTYKNGRISPLNLFLSTNDFSQLLARYKYLKTIQESDRKILGQLQTTKSSYTNQKETLEDKKLEAEKLKASLDALQSTLEQQKKDKENLLAITKNDEKTYQRLLAEARAEAAAIFSATTFIRDVNEGDLIGYVATYQNAPGCSSGEHLHFEVRTSSGGLLNPNDYLKDTSFSYATNYDLGKYGSISPHGSWIWPVNPPITINQGFGSHAYAQVAYSGGIHAGIDMDGGNTEIKAVKPGKLYAGSYNCLHPYPGTLPFMKLITVDGTIVYYQHTTVLK